MKRITFPKNESDKIISISIGSEKVVWLQKINKYILVTPPADQIIEQFSLGKGQGPIQDFCQQKLGFTKREAQQIVDEVKNNLEKVYRENDVQDINLIRKPIKNTGLVFPFKHYYQISGIVFFVEYQTAEIEYLIHPKYIHLEIPEELEFVHHIEVYESDSKYELVVDGEIIGSWSKGKSHFMTGKFSMELLQKIYKKEEDQWMAVFHASGISNGKECLIFSGDSGKGKSTLSAILMTQGYAVMADDFLPVLSENTLACYSPAAISVKKDAVDLLGAKFPELLKSQEYYYPGTNKTVRYLPNSFGNDNHPFEPVKCKALIFVAYKRDSGIHFNSMTKASAFQKLVPDSWISPLEKNASRFLEWFKNLPCYQLTYSDSDAMIETVNKLFKDEI
jgi:hypothetical protein